MKKIIINPDNIDDNLVTNEIYIYNLLIINSKNEIVLNKHHNTYYFIHEYDEGSIKNKYKIDINEYEPFLIKKEYVSDYPLFGDNTLYIKKYYKINMDMKIDNCEYISLNNSVNVLKHNKYNNPRNIAVIEEIVEVLSNLK